MCRAALPKGSTKRPLQDCCAAPKIQLEGALASVGCRIASNVEVECGGSHGWDFMSDSEPIRQSSASEAEQERRKLRRLQVMISMVMSVISQDPNMTIEEASELAAGAKNAALAMFPDKELAYDILYKPRLQRLMNERFRLQ